ncbi:MAG TPA: MFS transporter [Candidatus Cybelea sp.]|nr:MFS transporter [Candidatus Cybelea sp.]
MRGGLLIVTMSVCLVAALLPIATFPALVPVFSAEWGLSNAQAGWISGVYYLGYMLAVPFLMSATDRVDARLIFFAGATLSAAASFAYAELVGGFWSAFIWRALAGVALAGVYMPGLRALTDRITHAEASRGVAAYVGGFSFGSGISFLVAGWAMEAYGWRGAFVAAALGPLAALLVSLPVLRSKPPSALRREGILVSFRRVLGNRTVLGYILAYGTHNFEALALRGWVVSLLVFSVAKNGAEASWSPTVIATVLTILGLPGTLIGNELAIRLGRKRAIRFIMLESAAVAALVGLCANGPYGLLVALVLLHGLSVPADAGAIVAGAVQASAPEVQGATMALQASTGFGASFLGPLVVGIVLDLTGGAMSGPAWTAAFLVTAAVAALGPLTLRFGGPGDGERD